MMKKDLINKVHEGIEATERLRSEIESRALRIPDIDELADTVDSQGFDFLVNDSTSTIADELIFQIDLLDRTREQAKELLMNIIHASSEHDTTEQHEAKQEIINAYNDYIELYCR